MTVVKICGIRSPEIARASLEAGAQMLGFVFYQGSHRCVSVDDAQLIIAAARHRFAHGFKAVGVFVDEPVERVEEIVATCGLDLAQLCGTEDIEYMRRLRVPFIKVIRRGLRVMTNPIASAPASTAVATCSGSLNPQILTYTTPMTLVAAGDFR
jgi:phosphoribosylanthranilate isomerase